MPVTIHPAAEVEYRARPARGRRGDRARRRRAARIHTPGHRPEHMLPRRDRPLARRRAVARAHRRLALRRRRGPARPRRRRAEGAEGLFHSLRRLLELPDGVEVFPGHVAGSLCGKADELQGVDHDRLRAPLQPRAPDRATSSSSSPTRPRSPPRSRRTDAGSSSSTAARSSARRRRDRARRAPATAALLDVRAAATTSPATPRRPQRAGSGGSFATKAGFVLDADGRIVMQASSEDEAARAIRGLRAVGFLELEGSSSEAARSDRAGRPRRARRLLEDGAELIDVRERDKRDDG